ncbi:MAG: DUF3313 domain-containing protein [Geobacteraceae bacterium]|nr:DUF3313 domain-containing protein [Geobacteraceae bacterium]
MENVMKMRVVLTIMASALMLGGCGASYQARSVDVQNAMLVNPSILQKGGEDQALYRYVNPDVKIKQYDKVIIDPVIIVKEAQLDADELDNYKKLATNGFVYLTDELKQDYQIVDTPAEGTMRVQLAIVDADSSKPGRNILSSVMPIGIGVNAVKYAATGKQSGVGEITAEFKVTDATTGALLGAALDRRVGGKSPKGITDTWYNADQALQYWAKKVRFVMCTERGGTDCVKP